MYEDGELQIKGVESPIQSGNSADIHGRNSRRLKERNLQSCGATVIPRV